MYKDLQLSFVKDRVRVRVRIRVCFLLFVAVCLNDLIYFGTISKAAFGMANGARSYLSPFSYPCADNFLFSTKKYVPQGYIFFKVK